jgi:hypothetical protein
VSAVLGGVSVVATYIYYIHPELRIEDCLLKSGKGAEPI